jgi:hypothetical protein
VSKMAEKKLTEKVLIVREVSRPIADLVHFVRYAARRAGTKPLLELSDEILISYANDFWDDQHGED